MILRIISVLLVIVPLSTASFAQVLDDFSDGDFTSNPTWAGDDSLFTVNGSNVLQLNDLTPSTDEAHLSIANTSIDFYSWEFFVELDFNPSGSNRAFVYLVSDQADLEGSLDGYFVMIGNTDDEISLYRQDGSSTTKIIDGTDDLVDTNPVQVYVKVRRDDGGNWELFYDLENDGEYTLEGTANDATYTSTSYFGIVCDYTSSRSTSFYFDDFVVQSAIIETEIDTVIVNSETSLTVVFNQEVEETAAETSSNYSMDNGITINSVVRDAVDLNTVTISLNQSLTTNSYQLTVDNIADEFSNTVMSAADDFNFSYSALDISAIVTFSDSTVQVNFNQELDNTTASNASNYAINNGIGVPSAASIIENDSSKVILSLSSKLSEAVSYQISVSNVSNKEGNSSFTGNDTFEYIIPLLVDSVIVNSKDELLVLFSKQLDQTTAEAASNYVVNGGIGVPTTATLVNTDSVLLDLGSSLVTNNYTLTINDVEDIDNNAVATNTTSNFSYTALQLDSIDVISASNIILYFNQPIDSMSAVEVSNYNVDFGIGIPDSASYSSSNPDEVNLYLIDLANNTYEVSVENVLNEDQNAAAESLTSNFSVVVQTDFRDIIINEIFPDPNPSIGLPTAEFIELYNNSSMAIDLTNFTISGGTIGSFVLDGGAYVILSSSGDSVDFASYGDVIAVSSFPSLTNSGRSINLLDNLGNDVDSINYDLTWYNDSEKDDGGYSLELINQIIPCSDAFNWSASDASDGGTPGASNSILDNTADTEAPTISSIIAISSDSLFVTFNEPIDEASVPGGSYTIDGYAVTQSVAINSGFDGVYLILDADLVSENFYALSIENISDCSGNLIDDTPFEFFFDETPPLAEKAFVKSQNSVKIQFSEPLDDSSAEVANFSVDQGFGSPTGAVLDGTDAVLIEFDSIFSLGTTYTLQIENATDTSQNQNTGTDVLEFIYDQEIDTVIIIGTTLLDIYFKTAVDSSAASTSSNYYIVDSEAISQAFLDAENDSLVHIILLENLAENETLTLEIESLLAADSSDLITPDYTFEFDTKAPSLSNIVVVDSSSLVLTYNEDVELVSAELVNNYSLSNDQTPDSVRLQSSHDEVQLFFSESFAPETLETLSVKGVKDLFNNEITSTKKIEFTYDPLAPRLDSIRPISGDSVLIVFSETITQVSAETEENYIYNSNLLPVSATRYELDSSVVLLKFSETLPETDSLLVQVIGIEDHQGNIVSDTITTSLNTLNPTVASISAVSNDQIEITFSKTMNSGPLADENNYLVGDSLTIDSISILDSNQIILYLATHLVDQQEYPITVADLTDTTGNGLTQNFFSFLYDDFLESIISINSTTIQLIWSKQLSNPVVSNFEISSTNAQPIAISQDSDDPRITTLIFSQEITENVLDTLSWQGLSDIYGLTIPNSFFQFSIDTELPEVLVVNSVSLSQVSVQFSEGIDKTTALANNHYLLSTIGNPSSLELIDDSTVLLTFDQNLTDDTSYDLVIERVEDLSGNAINDTINFLFNAPFIPAEGELIITEIMADPSPSVGLPEVEYIEIYNGSDETINLSLISFGDRSSTTSIPTSTIASGEYVMLTANSDVAELSTYGTTIGVSNFPSLGNETDSLYLSYEKQLIDDVVYDNAWYGDPEKSDGGYSLERINMEQVCSESSNWTASQDSTGGTPGRINSVFNTLPDTIGPSVEAITVLANDRLTLLMSEDIDSLTISVVDFTIDNDLTISQISFPSSSQITLIFDDEIDSTTLYSIQIQGISDCTGNTMSPYSGEFGIGTVPGIGDLIFTEVMADPTPSTGLPEVEYVEIFNSGTSLLNLGSVSFSDDNTSISLPENLLAPGNYAILTSTNADGFDSEIMTIALSGFPSLGNSADSISLSTTTALLETVSYSSEWYKDSEKSDGGYALEKINQVALCDPISNWAASIDTLGGTPGLENSIFNNNPDNTLPQILHVQVVSNEVIAIRFNESMNPATLDPSNFILTPAVNIVEITALDFFNIQLQLEAPLETSILYSLGVSAIEDCAGNSLEYFEGNLGIGSQALIGDLIISEIMADPVPAVGQPEAEYIELFNRSGKLLDLSEVEIADRQDTTTIGGFLEPSAYVLITTTNNASQFSGNVVGISDFPSLGNSEDQISLLNQTDLIDQVSYTVDWYGDTDKDDGGYSLEIINPNTTCSGPSNWSASTDDSGGTPGIQNSIFSEEPDNTPPILLSQTIEDGLITLTFNEIMDLQSLNSANYEIQPALTISYVNPLASLLQVELVLEETPDTGTLYQLIISGMTDCTGNEIASTTISFGTGIAPNYHDILITEIMADPEPVNDLPNSEYIEIYNPTDHLLDISGLTLSGDDETTDISMGLIPGGTYALLVPNSSVPLFERELNVIGISNWPSLNNTGELITLSSNDEIIFDVHYEDSWYDDSFFEGGFSLEMIDTSNPCGEDLNWTISENPTGGTPGIENSVNASNPDLTDPELESVFAINSSSVLVALSEKLSPVAVPVFEFDPALIIREMNLLGPENKKIEIKFNEELEAQRVYSINISNLIDCNQNVSDPQTGEFVLPEEADSLDLVLNEILFNPRTNGVDFVEIFNRSERYINLKEWSFGNSDFFEDSDSKVITKSDLVIAPNEIMAFTTDAGMLAAEYPGSDSDQLIEVSAIPTLPNDEGTIILIDSADQIIDLFDYTDDFHYNLLEDTDGVSLERIDPNGTTNDGNNWRSASSTVGFATPGEVNSNQKPETALEKQVVVEPKVFIPGQVSTATSNFAAINYEFDEPGNFANVRIYNTKGQLIATIANGELLGTAGFFRWDGNTDDGRVAEVGYYIIRFEIYNSGGFSRVIKKTVVVGRDF